MASDSQFPERLRGHVIPTLTEVVADEPTDVPQAAAPVPRWVAPDVDSARPNWLKPEAPVGVSAPASMPAGDDPRRASAPPPRREVDLETVIARAVQEQTRDLSERIAQAVAHAVRAALDERNGSMR